MENTKTKSGLPDNKQRLNGVAATSNNKKNGDQQENNIQIPLSAPKSRWMRYAVGVSVLIGVLSFFSSGKAGPVEVGTPPPALYRIHTSNSDDDSQSILGSIGWFFFAVSSLVSLLGLYLIYRARRDMGRIRFSFETDALGFTVVDDSAHGCVVGDVSEKCPTNEAGVRIKGARVRKVNDIELHNRISTAEVNRLIGEVKQRPITIAFESDDQIEVDRVVQAFGWRLAVYSGIACYACLFIFKSWMFATFGPRDVRVSPILVSKIHSNNSDWNTTGWTVTSVVVGFVCLWMFIRSYSSGTPRTEPAGSEDIMSRQSSAFSYDLRGVALGTTTETSKVEPMTVKSVSVPETVSTTSSSIPYVIPPHLERYVEMRRSGLSENAIRIAMTRDKVSIEPEFLAALSTISPPVTPQKPVTSSNRIDSNGSTSPVTPPDSKILPKYQKMLDMGISKTTVANLMKKDGLSPTF